MAEMFKDSGDIFLTTKISHQQNKANPVVPKKRMILPRSSHKPGWGPTMSMSINIAKTSKAVSKGEWKIFAQGNIIAHDTRNRHWIMFRWQIQTFSSIEG